MTGAAQLRPRRSAASACRGRLFALVAALAAISCAAAAGSEADRRKARLAPPVEYDEVMGALLGMERNPHDPSRFRFDLAPWSALISDPKASKPKFPQNPALEGFLARMHSLLHLRSPAAVAAAKARKKREAAVKKKSPAAAALRPEAAGRPPKLVVVGAGPNGLVAALAARYHGYEVEVLEMTDGRDSRWNMVMVQGAELRAFLADVVGINSRVYYSVAEMQYVLAAAAQLAGVGVRYGRQYVRHCPASRAVLLRPTPAGADARRAQPGEAVCGAPGQLEKIEGVNMLVGADGVHSFVRAAMKGNAFAVRQRRPGNAAGAGGVVRRERESNTLKPVTTFKFPYTRRTVYLAFGRGPRRPEEVEHAVAAPAAPFRLMPDGTDTAAEPLLAMLIFELRPPPNNNVPPVTRPPHFRARVATQPAGAAADAPFDAMFAANGQLDRDRAMSMLVYKDDARRVVQRTPTADDPKAHAWQRYTYVDVVFRHRAGKRLWAAFHTLTAGAKLAEVAKHARGETNALTAGERTLADRLLRVMHETGGGYGVTLPQFRLQIAAIKLFGQQLRHAAHVYRKHKNLEVLLVGDSSRDSYFPHGESFSTAANAFLRFMDTKAARGEKSKSLTAAAQFEKEEVLDFLDVTAASIYYQGFCGIDSMETAAFKEISWTSIHAYAPDGDHFTVHTPANRPAAHISFGTAANPPPTRALEADWNRDARLGSFDAGWDNFVTSVLPGRCETW